MLVSFEVTNYGPFAELMRLTTEADPKKKEWLEENTFLSGGQRYNYVTYIYGFNGSGKSNIFKALISMQQILTLSPLVATNNQAILDSSKITYEVNDQRNFFKFQKGYSSTPTKYGIDLKIDGILYSYSFEVLDKKIISERLSKKLKRREVLIERTSPDYDSITLRSEFKSFDPFKNIVKENVPCLSMAMFLNNPLAVKIYEAINDITVINMPALAGAQFQEDDVTAESIQNYTSIVQTADKTIKKLDISLETEEINKRIQLSSDFECRDFILKQLKVDVKSIHAVYDGTLPIGEEVLPFLQFESNGTVKLLGILPAVFSALRNGGILFVDELENGLHPILTEAIVNLFYDKSTNPYNAQLICSSHETILLKTQIRRDQVWFLHKDDYGASSIKRLSEFPGARTRDDIAKRYLLGAFGEIPQIPIPTVHK